MSDDRHDTRFLGLGLGLALLLAACAGGAMTLRGMAADAKGGAVVRTDEGRVVYVGGLEAWPDDLRGRRVEVTGRIERKKLIPDPVVNERGEHSAGAFGDQEVVEDARWRALEEPKPGD